MPRFVARNQAVSLGDVLPMLGLAPDRVVGDYMNVMERKLCYTY